jgi:hypothetical protein
MEYARVGRKVHWNGFGDGRLASPLWDTSVEGITLKRGATCADYSTGRIATDRPDMLERMEAGNFSYALRPTRQDW